MLDRGTATIHSAHLRRGAVGAFSTYSLELTKAILEGASSVSAPVIVQAGSSAFSHAGMHALVAATVAAAEQSPTAVGVHLDHSRHIDEIIYCIEHGYTSVMFDGSHLPFDDNALLTKRVVEIAHQSGVWVEAELGAISGNEDRSGHGRRIGDATGMTDPEQASTFVELTGVDCLAVAIGNVHGFTSEPPELDFDRLERISQLCHVPLALHGASGLARGDLLRAVQVGVAKVNVNAELRRSFLTSLMETELPADLAMTDAFGAAITATALVVADKADILWGSGVGVAEGMLGADLT